MDITSLYTVIHNNEGLQALKYFFNQRPIKKPSSETLLRLAELVLTLNCLSFSDNYYKRITLTYHPQNHAIKSVILKNFNILRYDPETKHMFSVPPLISFKREKNLGNFVVRAHLSLATNQEPSHVNAHNAKLVPLFQAQSRSQEPIDPLKSLTTLHHHLR